MIMSKPTLHEAVDAAITVKRYLNGIETTQADMLWAQLNEFVVDGILKASDEKARDNEWSRLEYSQQRNRQSL